MARISKDIDNSSGACIDGDGILYVTNDASTGWVSEYALGHTKPLRVITEGIDSPAYCAIDESGNLWVTNVGLDDVAEYLTGSTKPRATITEGLTYPVGIAIDHAAICTLAIRSPMAQQTYKSMSQVAKSPSRTITDGVTMPVGIAVDANDTL